MRLYFTWRLFALTAALLMAGTGCSGINASKSVSPLDFLMPGLGGFGSVQPQPPMAPPGFLPPDQGTVQYTRAN